MRCLSNCSCMLCLELKDADKNVISSKEICDNFILTESPALVKKYAENFENKKLYYFGMEETDLNIKFNEETSVKDEVEASQEDAKHKSVIYINDVDQNSETRSNVLGDSSKIVVSEILDEYMTLNRNDCNNVINVIFKNTYPYATQLINTINSCNIDYNSEEFPLGIEADIFYKNHVKRQR